MESAGPSHVSQWAMGTCHLSNAGTITIYIYINLILLFAMLEVPRLGPGLAREGGGRSPNTADNLD